MIWEQCPKCGCQTLLKEKSLFENYSQERCVGGSISVRIQTRRGSFIKQTSCRYKGVSKND